MTSATNKPRPAPPECCDEPGDARRREGIERHARALEAAAADDRGALAHARAQRERQLLEADIALARRRGDKLECGINCLEEDIQAARSLARRI